LEEGTRLQAYPIYDSCSCNSFTVFFNFNLTLLYIEIISRAKKARRFEDKDTNDIWESNPDGLYTSPDPTDRERLTLDALEEMDLVDEDQHEIPIYTVDGFRVKRRIALFSPNDHSLGVLVDLATVNELFRTNLVGDTVYRHGLPGPQQATVTVYPQAGLRSAGHFQASGLMTSFYPFIEKISEFVREGPDSTFPIKGIACQGYNSVMHSTRGHGVQHHDAQQGKVTAALGGRFATGPTEKKKHEKFVRDLHTLPHILFDRKIRNPGIKRELRLENVYAIDMTKIGEEDQSGE
jgi:hypothetical protein